MKTIITYALLSLILAASKPYVLAQEPPVPAIIRVTSKYAKLTNQPTQATMPHSTSYGPGIHIFNVTIDIDLKDSPSFPDSLFGIVCIMPDNSAQKIFFVQENIITYVPQERSYSFSVRTSDGWMQVFLASRSELLSDKEPQFYKDRSNSEDVYLQSNP